MEWIMRLITAVVTATRCLESNPDVANSGLCLEEKLKHITMTANMGIWQATFNKEMTEIRVENTF
jgi:hypothetical protein